MLRPQDVIMACKLHLTPGDRPLSALALETGISISEAHNAIRRGLRSGLLVEGARLKVHPATLAELLTVAVPRIYYAERGEVTMGVPTGASAEVLKEHRFEQSELPLVWPTKRGLVRGESLKPIYKSATGLFADEGLYEILALIDVVRTGKGRDVVRAKEILHKIAGRGE